MILVPSAKGYGFPHLFPPWRYAIIKYEIGLGSLCQLLEMISFQQILFLFFLCSPLSRNIFFAAHQKTQLSLIVLSLSDLNRNSFVSNITVSYAFPGSAASLPIMPGIFLFNNPKEVK